jgi:hypothetical protein
MSSEGATVTLFHGTTAEAATAIAVQGLLSVSPAITIRSVAAEYDVEELDIHRVLRVLNQFVAVQDDRDKYVWLSATPEKAASWAQRAPESRWEALRAVWFLIHRDQSVYEAFDSAWDADRFSPEYRALQARVFAEFRGEGLFHTEDFERWRFGQYASVEPAVVAIDVPKSQLPNNGSGLIVAGRSVPEVAVTPPVPHEWVGETIFPGRWVGRRLAIALLGVSDEEFDTLLRENALPEFHESFENVFGHWMWCDLESLAVHP